MDKSAALPYASCYQPESARFKQEQSSRMMALLAQSGMEVDGSFSEPEDHLALILELLSRLNFAITKTETPNKDLLALRCSVK